MSDISKQQITAWHALLAAHRNGQKHVQMALKEAGLPGPDVYDALCAIAESDTPDLTAKALEAQIDLPQYGVSRLLDRLERDGLITRKPNPVDQRSRLIQLTDLGHQTRQDIWQVYGTAIADFLGPRAKPGQLDRMADLLKLLYQDPGD